MLGKAEQIGCDIGGPGYGKAECGGLLRSPQRVGERLGKFGMVAVPRIERGTRGL
jgi:hypothetical protein